ncbi:hypothetical protein GDO78_019765 [Eleutherodactylus coqui]|uniref:Uncharacterized protein n=1 Tax=Eleutherodactylus coqui TaxID=57060 RepID=A0A8J6EI55_ELECQ|nr:hypothetical protein GDO78_019765 [Eleutherodactylus coqui]
MFAQLYSFPVSISLVAFSNSAALPAASSMSLLLFTEAISSLKTFPVFSNCSPVVPRSPFAHNLACFSRFFNNIFSYLLVLSSARSHSMAYLVDLIFSSCSRVFCFFSSLDST